FAAASDTGADWEDVLQRAGEGFPARRFDRRPLVLALAAAIVVAASLVVVFVANGTRRTSPGSPAGPNGGTLGLGDPPTLARPLPVPGAEQVSLSDAESAFG